jgi:uncharacterized protein (TIGR02453 family)
MTGRRAGAKAEAGRTPFSGWPRAAFDFYAELETDNSKSFWQANKGTYDESVKRPFDELSAEIESKFGPLKLFRPYRDVRFSGDKSPYKTAAGAIAQRDGAIYYVQVNADGLFAGCGMYAMAPDQLGRYRAALDHDRLGPQIAGIVDGLRADGYEIGSMDALKTAPKGFPKDHPRIELLRMKGLTVGRDWPLAKWMHTAAAKARILEVWTAAENMNAWLADHVGPSTLPPR